MKTVSTAFKDAQKSPATVSVRRISYKRRYWVQSSNAYTWESSWTVLPENEVVSVSPITGKLDTDKLNEFKISNVSLVLKNERRQWKAGKRGGYFGATTTYPDGFEPYWTKFKIESGYEVAGVATYVTLFVGLATGYKVEAFSDTIQVDVQGLEALLINANAEDISTLVKYENMGTGNGTNKDFTTVHPGVGIVKEVLLNGIVKKPGTDYSISQTDEPTLGAKISFTTAPSSGVVVLITYRYWKQNQKIEDVVIDLLTVAKTSTGALIESVIFPGGILDAFHFTSQSDFSSGSTSDGDISRVPGEIRIKIDATSNYELLDDFSDGNFTSTPAWTPTTGSDFTISISSNKLLMAQNNTLGSVGVIDTSSGGARCGYWKMSWNTGATDSVGGEWVFAFIGNARDNSFYSPCPHSYTGSFVQMRYQAGGVTYIDLVVDGSTLGTYTLYANTTAYLADRGTVHLLEIIKTPDGSIKVFIDGSKKIDVSNGSSSSPSNYFGFGSGDSYGFHNMYFDGIFKPKSTLSATWISQSFDMGTGVTGFGRLERDFYTGSGTVNFYTSTSADGTTWDSWIECGSGGQINSTVRRYGKIKIVLTMPSSSTNEPSVSHVGFIYTKISTSITMPTFADKTVYQAMQQIGSFANYEWGFNEAEVFFFRPKQVDKIVDENLDGSINVIDVSSLSDGVERVYSEVQATYGNFDITVGDDGMAKDGPIARYGKRRLTIDGGDILLAPDTDVASGIALSFYDALKKPRQTMKVRAKLMEWLDLSDTVSLTFNDNIPARPWFFGDTSAYFGDQTLYFFGDADQTAKGMLCKVVGYRHDTENKTSEFDLEEIL